MKTHAVTNVILLS